MLANADEKAELEAAVAEEQAKVDVAAAAVKAAEDALATAKVDATKTDRAELAAYYLALHGACVPNQRPTAMSWQDLVDLGRIAALRRRILRGRSNNSA